MSFSNVGQVWTPETLRELATDKARLDKLAALATETEFCIAVCCDDITDPAKPKWWLERDDQILPTNLRDYAQSLREAIDAVPNPTP